MSDNNGFTAEYGTAGYETAKEFFKNRVIDQHTFSVFMKSSVDALSGTSIESAYSPSIFHVIFSGCLSSSFNLTINETSEFIGVLIILSISSRKTL